jgi:uncharacterized membrane protein YeaQ/YmgE (transglycosylase-associated protein family)
MIGFVVAGLVIGAVARLIMPGKQQLSIWMTLVLGLAGSVVGGTVAAFLGTGDVWELNVLGSVVAVTAAVALIGVAEGLSLSAPRSRPALDTRRNREAVLPVAGQPNEEIR